MHKLLYITALSLLGFGCNQQKSDLKDIGGNLPQSERPLQVLSKKGVLNSEMTRVMDLLTIGIEGAKYPALYQLQSLSGVVLALAQDGSLEEGDVVENGASLLPVTLVREVGSSYGQIKVGETTVGTFDSDENRISQLCYGRNADNCDIEIDHNKRLIMKVASQDVIFPFTGPKLLSPEASSEGEATPDEESELKMIPNGLYTTAAANGDCEEFFLVKNSDYSKFAVCSGGSVLNIMELGTIEYREDGTTSTTSQFQCTENSVNETTDLPWSGIDGGPLTIQDRTYTASEAGIDQVSIVGCFDGDQNWVARSDALPTIQEML